MNKINNVWTASYIHRCLEAHRTEYTDHDNRQIDLWANAQDKMRDALSALVAWGAETGMTGGPDASDFAKLLDSVCDDANMAVGTKSDYDDVDQKAKQLGKMIRAMLEYIQRGRPDLIKDYIRDCIRFERFDDAAWRDYVDEPI